MHTLITLAFALELEKIRVCGHLHMYVCYQLFGGQHLGYSPIYQKPELYFYFFKKQMYKYIFSFYLINKLTH